jgi:dTDP-glucose pyrophosphorylase
MPGRVFHALARLWRTPGRGDEYIGTLMNAYIAEGGAAIGIKAGHAYVDVGTLHGYRAAVSLLSDRAASETGDARSEGEPFALQAFLQAPAPGARR